LDLTIKLLKRFEKPSSFGESNQTGENIMEKSIYSFIGFTLVLTLSCGVVQSAVGLWHEHTDGIQLLSIERNDTVPGTGNLVAIAH
jgi:hypothetical protein